MEFKLKKTFIYFLFFYFFFNIEGNSKEVPTSFADLAEKLMPSVVNIYTTQTVVTNVNPFPFEFPPGSPFRDMFKDFGSPQKRKTTNLGSGFIIDAKGIVVTNNHVISNAEDIYVRLDDGREHEAKVLGADPLSDVAVLKILSKDKFIPVKFGDSDKARIGDWVIAMGNPLGLNGTVTSGIISARNRDIGMNTYEDFIQTDASINVGNSGGPLFNMNGDVIGINTAIFGRDGSIGIGFSIPSNSAKRVVEQLIEFGETNRGWLGVKIQVVTKEIAEYEKLDEARGALVVDVAENSPSDKAGIKDGDIILEFNGVLINEMKELPKIVGQFTEGKTIKVKIWRNEKELLKKVTLGRRETTEDFKVKKQKKTNESEIESLKIKVRPIKQIEKANRGLPRNLKGLVITEIANDSPINYLSIGNIIIEAQKRAIKTVGDLEISVKAALKSKEKTLLIVIYNNQNQRRYIGVKLN